MSHNMLASLLVAGVASSALADPVFDYQKRWVEAENSVETQFDECGDFAPFDAEVNVAHGSYGYATGRQKSVFGPSGISVDSYAYSKDGTSGAYANAESLLEVWFTIDEATDFTISGKWKLNVGSQYIGYDAKILLREYEGSDVFVWWHNTNTHPYQSGQFEFQGSGTLQPGSYQFFAKASVSSRGYGTNTASADLIGGALIFPAPSTAALLLFGLAFRRRR